MDTRIQLGTKNKLDLYKKAYQASFVLSNGLSYKGS